MSCRWRSTKTLASVYTSPNSILRCTLQWSARTTCTNKPRKQTTKACFSFRHLGHHWPILWQMLYSFSKHKCFVTDIHKQLTVHLKSLIQVAIAHSYEHLQKQVRELHTWVVQHVCMRPQHLSFCDSTKCLGHHANNWAFSFVSSTSTQVICASVSKPRYCDAFRDILPITVNGNAPTKAQATEAGFENYHS